MKNAILISAILVLGVALGTACASDTSTEGKTRSSASPPASSDSTSPKTPAAQETTRSADPRAEDDLAESMLLTIEDFPPGWVHKPYDDSQDAQAPDPNPLEPCSDDSFAGQTGSAIGGEFSDENTTLLSVNPSVYVFESAESAQSAADTIVSNAQCFADVIGDGLDIDETFAFGRTYVEPLSAEAFGATAAIRLVETQIYKDERPPDSDVLVFDVVIVVEGRVLVEVDGFQRHSPIDQALLQLYLNMAREKIPEAV
jgi:hypothetical protein